MGRRISIGIEPASFGNFNLNTNNITVATANTDINLAPTGTGVVQAPANYLTRTLADTSFMPRRYIDNNISPGMLFISFD